MCRELVEVRTSLQLKICSHGRNQSEQPGIFIQAVSVVFQSSVVIAERGWRSELTSQRYMACTSRSRHSLTPRLKISNPFTWFWDSPVPVFWPLLLSSKQYMCKLTNRLGKMACRYAIFCKHRKERLLAVQVCPSMWQADITTVARGK